MPEVSQKIARKSGARAGTARPFFSTTKSVQRACAGCSEGSFFTAPKIQRETQDGGGQDLEIQSEEPVSVQPQLEIGAVNDPLETEADRAADQVVRRMPVATAGQSDEGTIQPKRDDEDLVRPKAAADGSGPANPELAAGITRAQGSGAQLAPDVRGAMEDSFGLDLSPVRVHTGPSSARMNDSIGARAFTYGTDIHFNSGEFNPSSREGTRLLAHEMAHVVQQTRGLKRKPKAQHGTVRRAAKGKIIRRATRVLGPVGGFPSGTLIHGATLPKFLKKNVAAPMAVLNPDLTIEPKVPGGNKRGGGTDLASYGYPDFYVGKSLVGVKLTDSGDFEDINQTKKTKARGPTAPENSGDAMGAMGDAPQKVGLGDLKPGFSGEMFLGSDQISNYVKGIKGTAAAVNAYQNTHGHSPRWSFVPVKNNPSADTKIKIPDKLKRPDSTSGVSRGPLAVWDFSTGRAKYPRPTGMSGSLVIYHSEVDGIYAYEWMPDQTSLSGTHVDPVVEEVLNRLRTDVMPRITGRQKKKTASPKRKPGARAVPAVRRGPAATVRRAPARPFVRRNIKDPAKFDRSGWTRDYGSWKKRAGEALGPKGKEKDALYDALHGMRRRGGYPGTIPKHVRETGKAYKSIRHWHSHGSKYAWFREKFGKVFVRIQGFVEKVKRKFAGLRKSGGAAFGSWAKAAAKAIMKVVKLYASWALDQIADKLVGSLQKGISDIAAHIVDAVLPDDAKSAVEVIRDKRKQINGLISGAQKTLEDSIFGDAMKFVQNFAAFEKVVDGISTIIGVVEWGIRIAACAAPPLIGCLWNLAMSALQWAFSKIMDTCWFQKKVFGWFKQMRNHDLVKPFYDFPTNAATTVVEKANALIPLPEGFPPVFAKVEGIQGQEVDCAGGGGGEGGGIPLTPEQKALMDLSTRLESQEKGKFEALVKMLAARAPDHATELDANRIAKLADLAKDLTIARMEKIAKGDMSDVSVPVEEFLKSLSTPTEGDKKRRKTRKIDYEKAQKNNKLFKDSIGWKPKTFARDGIDPGSKEFADTVYDVQEALGIKADGMAGPNTTKAHYDRQGLKKDGAYRNAVAEIEAARIARENVKAIEKAKAEPFPANTQLVKDLKGLGWPTGTDTREWYPTVDGRKLIAIITSDGKRIGGYYKTANIRVKEKKRDVIVEISDFYALDAIAEADVFSVGKSSLAEEKLIIIESYRFDKAVPANSFVKVANLWFMAAVN
ncbi:eCIS core domain-containing protein [Marimonas arenosa]|uniref:DUF4157 domain-containing protein n=1 Tax=Marimonas arenosa TaxID=1795305 RepID=A0AAE3WA48_9RHOB|nr:DUF4157 domain-containing protein [Marimonas arenosa]MDQ2088733.1 DUF4157 domain-containing protein [Marimonas arenosa]